MSNKYNISIHTGDEVYAGTDSNIFIQLIGNKGISEEYRLNGLLSGNAFERNDTNKLTLDVGADCGDIYRLKIRSDCRYGGSDWLLSWIDVKQDNNNAPISRFSYNAWIKDTGVKELDVASGLTVEDKVKELYETEYSGEIITIPANSEADFTYKYTTKLGILLSETEISEIGTSTNTSAEASYKSPTGAAAKAAISFGITTKKQKESHQELKYDTIGEKEIKIHLKASDIERKYKVYCTYKKQDHTLRIGSLVYKVPVMESVENSGFEEIK
ncbi:PLAT/LH2 domain protein [Oxobacter pfennigii]|uniref:PLAT/LH2 domain protein n=1 Tax=Oxobacter pfennigii TaxID=36849 RepID=A0A0P8WYL2_9CLOT|nr:PLAT/LH2 domain-containing protein [Oxobacter pfennigii]KPU43506.1 PLAT/LH2 domain protein [Oxobacter pfennigii]